MRLREVDEAEYQPEVIGGEIKKQEKGSEGAKALLGEEESGVYYSNEEGAKDNKETLCAVGVTEAVADPQGYRESG